MHRINGSKWLTVIGIAAYLFYMATVLVGAARHPYYNWDMVPYIGAVKSLKEQDAAALQRKTFEEIKYFAPAYAYDALTLPGKKDYRSIVAEDPRSFVQQLPFYTVKPLYIETLALLHQLGGWPIFEAIIFLSVFSCALVMGLMAKWRPDHVHPGFWLLLLIPLFHTGKYPIQSLAYLATPDAFSILLLVGAFFLLVVKHKRDAALGLLLLSLFARGDNLLLILPLLACLTLCAPNAIRLQRKRALIWAAAAVGCYLLAGAIGHGYGWATLFYHSFVQIQNYPADGHPPLDVEMYWKAFKRGFGYMWNVSHRQKLFFVAAVLGAASWRWLPEEKRFSSALLMVALIYGIAHFLLFPDLSERYFYFVYLLIAYAFTDIAAYFIHRSRKDRLAVTQARQ